MLHSSEGFYCYLKISKITNQPLSGSFTSFFPHSYVFISRSEILLEMNFVAHTIKLQLGTILTSKVF